jgi:deoxycytidylate deaminase
MSNYENQDVFDDLFEDALNGEKTGNARVSAFLTNGKDSSYGRNSKKSHPFQKRFGTTEECIYLHAEIKAIKNFLRFNGEVDDLPYTTLFVMRVKRDGRKGPIITGLAKPCEGCMRAIVEFCIPFVYYTEDNAKRFTCL